MKFILNSKYKSKLIFKKKVFNCQIGKNGSTPLYRKKEGDGCTPLGKWELKNIYYRRDRANLFKAKNFLREKIIPIKNTFIWCDDTRSKFYNKLFKKNYPKQKLKFSYECLFRNDELYDILIELNHNQNPIIKNKGSAIFIHCSSVGYNSTLGCIALKKNHLKYLINNLQKKNYIYIR